MSFDPDLIEPDDEEEAEYTREDWLADKADEMWDRWKDGDGPAPPGVRRRR